MTDTGNTASAYTPVDALAGALRVATAHDDDERTRPSGDDLHAVTKLESLYAEKIVAAAREIEHAGHVRAQATNTDHRTVVATDFADAVADATRWADALARLSGIEVPASGDPAVDAAHRALIGVLTWLIARDGVGAASVIYYECRRAVQDARLADPEGLR